MKVLFDRALKQVHRSAINRHPEHIELIHKECVLEPIAERLTQIRDATFPNIAVVGPYAHFLLNSLDESVGVRQATVVDMSQQSLQHSLDNIEDKGLRIQGIKLDEDTMWGFPDNYFNLIVSNMSLHWLNGIGSCIDRFYASLDTNGALIGSWIGGDTLQELRIAFTLAEQEREGGLSPHVSPMLQLSDIGQLFMKSGLDIITTTWEEFSLYFDNSYDIVEFVRNVGESNAHVGTRESISRETALSALAIYQTLFKSKEKDEYEGKLPTTMHLYHFIGWKEPEKEKKDKKVDLSQMAEELDEVEYGELIEEKDDVKTVVLKKREIKEEED